MQDSSRTIIHGVPRFLGKLSSCDGLPGLLVGRVALKQFSNLALGGVGSEFNYDSTTLYSARVQFCCINLLLLHNQEACDAALAAEDHKR